MPRALQKQQSSWQITASRCSPCAVYRNFLPLVLPIHITPNFPIHSQSSKRESASAQLQTPRQPQISVATRIRLLTASNPPTTQPQNLSSTETSCNFCCFPNLPPIPWQSSAAVRRQSSHPALPYILYPEPRPRGLPPS